MGTSVSAKLKLLTLLGMRFALGTGIPWNGNKTPTWEWEWEGGEMTVHGNGLSSAR